MFRNSSPPFAKAGRESTRPLAANSDNAPRSPALPSSLPPGGTNDVPAVSAAAPRRARQIGRILVEAGKLTPSAAEKVLGAQAQHKLRFGEIAVRMGLIRQQDVDHALARQFAFPAVALGDLTLSTELVAAFSPNHPTAERLRGLRSVIALRAVSQGRQHPAVAIVSPNRGDGRSFVAANLAVVFAQLGQRTLLIDANLRSPVQHLLFKLENRAGLSTMLAGRAGADCVQRVGALPRLHVLTAGPTPPNPLELIEQAVLPQLLQSADHNFKIVIIDTPAAQQGADAQVLAARTGATVMVARANQTHAEDARRFTQALNQAQASVLGVVFNEH